LGIIQGSNLSIIKKNQLRINHTIFLSWGDEYLSLTDFIFKKCEHLNFLKMVGIIVLKGLLTVLFKCKIVHYSIRFVDGYKLVEQIS